ncbi:aminotransferase-like domain-containing protein [Chitinimonas koreensis]|uniref:aminotransferase-like domain-containing protein n=1 Tax=Chitinimonas koreensis TaxID=356302 RepID=UPI00040EF8A6|nr:PLP-dependent aminotransferase family protein [Chitinimonas koreensis]QNM97982.1 PLP-dependent aminotransferase family protein [Chitinimonas koreensis]
MTTRYQALTDDLAGRIRAGVLQAGDKLPSVRQLCALHQASPATVTHALHRLEDAGLIEARPRQGFFVRRQVRAFAPPSQCAVPGLPQAIELEGHRKLVHEFTRSQCHDWLGLSNISPDYFPTEALNRLLKQQLRQDPDLLGRHSHQCVPALREQIARRSVLLGCDWRPEEIVVTHGGHEAADLCLRLLTRPGDVVAIQAPSGLLQLELLAGLGLRVLEIPAHPCDGLSVEALAFALRHNRVAACVVTANFPSPTGSLMSDEAKARLVALTAEHGVPLLEIDTLGDLYHGDRRPKPCKAFDRDGRVLYCADLGVLAGPGVGIGYVVAGRERLRVEAGLLAHGAAVPLLMQRTLAAFMASGQFEPHLRRLRGRLADNLSAYRCEVYRHFPEGTRVACAPGGYLLWVELPGGIDATELRRRALVSGYTFAPGALFSLGDSFRNCLRINCGYGLNGEIAEAIRVIGGLAGAMRAEPSPRERAGEAVPA